MLVLLDLTILVLASLRFTRLFTTDSIPGNWWIYGPLYKRAVLAEKRKGGRLWWSKYLEGLTCPFCIGFWMCVVVLASLMLVGGPGDAPVWWQVFFGVFALNYVTGHVSSRLD